MSACLVLCLVSLSLYSPEPRLWNGTRLDLPISIKTIKTIPNRQLIDQPYLNNPSLRPPSQVLIYYVELAMKTKHHNAKKMNQQLRVLGALVGDLHSISNTGMVVHNL